MNADDIKKLIDQKAAADPKLRLLMKQIENGNATFKETSEYTRIFSSIIGKMLSENVISLEERELVAILLFRYGYDNINGILERVQTDIDRKNRVNIRPQKAPFPKERVYKFSHSLTDPTVPDETIERRANNGTANITMSFHDDYMRENAKFRSNAGLRCYIDRQTNGKCCQWCSDIAGRYEYGSEPGDIYRRHDNCDCTVIFENGRQRQDVWSKRSWVADREKKKYTKPTIISRAEAQRLNEEKRNAIFINNPSIDNGSESGIIELKDSNNLYKPVTQDAIDNIPLLNAFDDSNMNKRQQQAAKDLLSEVKKHDDVPIGTEFSIRYDENMQPIKNEKYIQGKVGSVRIDDLEFRFHAFHNHGSNETFSVVDMMKLSDIDNMISLTVAGNSGNNFIMFKNEKYDKYGFQNYLNTKSKDVFYKAYDFDFSFETMRNKELSMKFDVALKSLNEEQMSEIKVAISNKFEEIAEGGIDYGVEYKKARLVD